MVVSGRKLGLSATLGLLLVVLLTASCTNAPSPPTTTTNLEASTSTSTTVSTTSTSAGAWTPAPIGEVVDPGVAASQVGFNVFWLGPSFTCLPLRSVEVRSARRVDLVYAHDGAGEPPDPADVITLLESSASDSTLRKEIESGLRASGKTAEQFTEGGIKYTFWSGGEGWPTLVLEKEGTLVVISSFDYQDGREVLLDAAVSLEAVDR